MLDWLAIWGVYTVAGFVFTEVLAPLAKGALEDYVKDFFKDSIKDFTGLFQKDTLQTVVGKALKEFLQLVQQELEDAELSEEELKAYTKPLNQFINDKSVKEILGSAFQSNCKAVDTKRLAKIWYQLDLLSLPEGFDWEQVGKRYFKKVKALIRETDELRAILDSQNIEAIQQSTQELAGISPEFDLKRYQEGLQERYGNLNLDSLDTTVYDYREKLKVWQIFTAQNVRECQDFLPQVYEIPKEHQKRLRESNELEADVDPQEWERYKQVYYQQSMRTVLDVVNDSQNYPYIVILGDPGSGKSTLLQYIALNWARTPLTSVIEQPIPLLIELRTYKRDRNSGQCKDFLEFFHKGSVICRLNQHELHERLKAGKVLVMFDGLDEVFDPAQREEVITDIHRFTNDYPNVRVIVTSRIIGYKPQRLRDAEFCHFMLQDLEPDQIQDFIYRWHELTFTDEADKVRKRERLQHAIKTSSAIGELAGNPLLLTMMAILNRNQELPRDRPELYNQASRVLLHQWDIEQKLLENPRIDSVAIDYKDKQAMLRQVAYHMQAAEKGLAGNLIRGEDLERILTGYLKSIEVSQARTVARLLIEQLRSRNFILCFLGADSYGFVHRTFLEYFCACEFVERLGKRGLVGGFTLEELKTEVFGKHWQDESWHEVLRLITGMIDTSFAGEIIDYLIIEELDFLIEESFYEEVVNLLFLAAECFTQVRNRSAIASTDNRLFKSIKDLTKYDPMGVLPIAVITSADEAEYEDMVGEVRTQVISMIATTWRNHPETLPLLKTLAWSGHYGHDGNAQATAVRELARGWKDDPEILPRLKALAESSDNGDDTSVQVAAIQELAQGWKDDPEILPMLKVLAESSTDSRVKAMAVRELVRGWRDNPETLTMLKVLAKSNDSPQVHRIVVEELAQGWKNDPDTLPILTALTQSSDQGINKIAVAEELARGWKNDPKILSVLKICVQLENSNWRKGLLRYAVMNKLIREWQPSSDIYDFLYNCAVDSSFNGFILNAPHPRQTALEVMIKRYRDHPQTLPLLKDRAENDSDEKVREFAREKLAELEE